MEPIWQFGLDVVTAVQGWGDWLLLPMHVFTSLGIAEFYLLLMCVLFWDLDRRLGLRVGILLLLSGTLNESLKVLCHQPRPYWLSSGVRALSAEETFGMPSGHAQLSYGVWGLIGASLRRRWAIIAALAMTMLIGFSRIYLGVHLPTDVLAGWVLGGLVLWLFLSSEHVVANWWGERTLTQQLLIAFAGSIMLAIIPAAIHRVATSGWQVPVTWEQMALANSGEEIDPFGSFDRGRLSGLFLGAIGGAAIIERRGGFSVRGKWWQHGCRLLLGLAGVGLLYVGLDLEMRFVGSLSYVRYALIGLWISFVAPELFIKLKLTGRKARP